MFREIKTYFNRPILVILPISHLGYEGKTLCLVAPDHDHSLPFYFNLY